jgi:tryptophan-rich sensory protein
MSNSIISIFDDDKTKTDNYVHMYKDYLYWESMVIIVSIAYVSAVFMSQGLSSEWYRVLPYKSWMPPTEFYGMFWLMFYLFIGVLAYIATTYDPLRFVFPCIFGVALLLQFVWIYMFFVNRNLFGSIFALLFCFIFYCFVTAYVFTYNRFAGGMFLVFDSWLLYLFAIQIYYYVKQKAV